VPATADTPAFDSIATGWGARLRTLRKRHGWTRRRAARELNLSYGTVRNLEDGGVVTPHVDTCRRIALREGSVLPLPLTLDGAQLRLELHSQVREDGLWEAEIRERFGPDVITAYGFGVGLDQALACWAAVRALIDCRRSARRWAIEVLASPAP